MRSKAELAGGLLTVRARTEALTALHQRWTPHQGQIEAGTKIFYEGCKILFMQCGRNFGKTQFLVYCCVRFALLNPNSHVYLIGPQRKQEAEIVWHSKLLHNMIPDGWIGDPDRDVNKSELRITLKNGSFIKIDGADDPDALRGYKPHFLACDEFKDWRKDSFQAMEPNLIAKKATVVIAGTPPDVECYFTEYADFVKREMYAGNQRYYFMLRPTHTNPHIDKADLNEIERAHNDRGEDGIFRREYLAEFVPGGARAIFGMFSRYTHVKSMYHINQEIMRDRNKMKWVNIFDPASTSVFGSLFLGYNQYTKRIYVTSEIYERDSMLTSTTKIWPRAVKIQSEHYSGQWYNVCDNAEQWFINEVRDSFGYGGIVPTHKRVNQKEQELSLIKDIFNWDLITIAEDCRWFIHELENYVATEAGKIDKCADHLIDCFRYFLVFINYTLPDEPEHRHQVAPEYADRPKTLEQDYQEWLREKHPEFDMLGDFEDLDLFLS